MNGGLHMLDVTSTRSDQQCTRTRLGKVAKDEVVAQRAHRGHVHLHVDEGAPVERAVRRPAVEQNALSDGRGW